MDTAEKYDNREDRGASPGAEGSSLIPEDAFERDLSEGTLGAEEELWLADPRSLKLADGAQIILARAPQGNYTGELIDC